MNRNSSVLHLTATTMYFEVEFFRVGIVIMLLRFSFSVPWLYRRTANRGVSCAGRSNSIAWFLIEPPVPPLYHVFFPLQALNHSLGQMELRMSGRHTTKNSTACRRKDYSQFHRRTQSALPVSRADAPTFDIRPPIPLGGGGRVEKDDDDTEGAPSSFWKLTPPASRPSGGSGAVAPASVAVKSPPRFDFRRSPRQSRPASRGHFGFEGYFAAESTAAAAAAAEAKAAKSSRTSCQPPEDDLCGASGVPVEEDGYEDPDSACMFEFDDM